MKAGIRAVAGAAGILIAASGWAEVSAVVRDAGGRLTVRLFNPRNQPVVTRIAGRRGWTEYSVYPLYSPQSLIAEGSANYGIDLAFPGPEKLTFETPPEIRA